MKNLKFICSVSYLSAEVFSFLQNFENSTHLAYALSFLSHISWKRNILTLPQSVQFSRSVVSDSLWPHELQHTRPSCPSPTPGVHSNSRPQFYYIHTRNEIIKKIKLNILWFAKKKRNYFCLLNRQLTTKLTHCY